MSDNNFGKEVGQVFRGIKQKVEEMPVTSEPVKPAGSIDRSVKEQVITDIDRLIEKHEKG